MVKIHLSAISVSVLHFIFCSILFVVVMVVSAGYSLSDSYREPIWWFVAMDRLLMVLDAPVIWFLWRFHHPIAWFRPPRLFITDFTNVAPFSTVVGLCAAWSIVLGYVFVCVVLLIKTRLRSGFGPTPTLHD